MEVLFVAAKDPAATVVRQCLDTLQVVIDSHWKSWGKRHDVLIECVKVAERCARNPHHLESSLRAVQVLKFCATELLHDGASTEDVLVGELFHCLIVSGSKFSNTCINLWAFPLLSC